MIGYLIALSWIGVAAASSDIQCQKSLMTTSSPVCRLEDLSSCDTIENGK